MLEVRSSIQQSLTENSVNLWSRNGLFRERSSLVTVFCVQLGGFLLWNAGCPQFWHLDLMASWHTVNCCYHYHPILSQKSAPSLWLWDGGYASRQLADRAEAENAAEMLFLALHGMQNWSPRENKSHQIWTASACCACVIGSLCFVLLPPS